MVSVFVLVMIWGGGGGGGGGQTWGGCWGCWGWWLSWDGGTGWVGNWSGRALGMPAPARLETDWMTGIDVSVWPAFETWAELLVEVPVEVETTIGAPLDLLTLKKLFYNKYEFYHFFHLLQAITDKVFN